MFILYIIILIVHGNCAAKHLKFRTLHEKIKEMDSQNRCCKDTNNHFPPKQYIVSVPDSGGYWNTSKIYKGTIIENNIGVSWTSKEGVKIYDGPNHKVREILLNDKNIRLQFTNQNSYDELIEALVNKSVDLLLTPLYYSEERYKHGDFTTPVFASPYCLVMLRENSFSVVLLLPFQPLVWAILGLSLLCAALAWHVVKDRPLNSALSGNQVASFFDAVFDVVQTVLNNTCSSRAISLPQRQVLIILMMFSLVLGHAYSGQLLGFLAAPPARKDPQTLLEAVSKINYIYLPKNMMELLKDMDKNIKAKFKYRLYNTMDETLRNMITKERNGVVLSLDNYFTISTLPNKDKQVVFHVVPECFVSPGFSSYIVAKKSPIYNQINSITKRIVESGLYRHWKEVQIHDRAANGVIELHDDARKEPEPLRLNQLSGIFMVLEFGFGISISVFTSEVIVKLFYQGIKRKSKKCDDVK